MDGGIRRIRRNGNGNERRRGGEEGREGEGRE
jgi:hypothetical protein